jgi:hypothetical protein
MTDGFKTECAKRVSKKVFREALEYSERKLKRIQGQIRKGLQDKFSTLDVVRSKVETGDRKAMLELLTLVADSVTSPFTTGSDAGVDIYGDAIRIISDAPRARAMLLEAA